MTYKYFKSKKRDVVQYILVLTVITIILAYAFPKIRDKMGVATKSTTSNIDVGLGNMFSNSNQNGTPQEQCIPITLPPVNHDVPLNMRSSYQSSNQYEYYDDVNDGSGIKYRIYFYSNNPVTFRIVTDTTDNTIIYGDKSFTSFSWWTSELDPDYWNTIGNPYYSTFSSTPHVVGPSLATDLLGVETTSFTTLPQRTCQVTP